MLIFLVFFFNNSSPHIHRLVSWVSLIEGSFKINVDEIAFGNLGKSSFSGLFRNSFGEWLSGLEAPCGYSSCLYVELMAILYGPRF